MKAVNLTEMGRLVVLYRNDARASTQHQSIQVRRKPPPKPDPLPVLTLETFARHRRTVGMATAIGDP